MNYYVYCERCRSQWHTYSPAALPSSVELFSIITPVTSRSRQLFLWQSSLVHIHFLACYIMRNSSTTKDLLWNVQNVWWVLLDGWFKKTKWVMVFEGRKPSLCVILSVEHGTGDKVLCYVFGSVCLSFCQQDYRNTMGPVFMKPGWSM